MKLSKVSVSIALATASVGFINTALADHFTVNGSENGTFEISGTVIFGSYSGASITSSTYFPPGNQTDADNPPDNGTPLTYWTFNDGSLSQYPCKVTMYGSVVNGVASITSMTASGSTFCTELITTNFPWRIHTLSQGNYSAVIKGIDFYHTGVFTCQSVSVGVGIQPGLIGFGGPLKQGGCFLQTNMAITLTPSLQIVPN